jgi:hypothetical protein
MSRQDSPLASGDGWMYTVHPFPTHPYTGVARTVVALWLHPPHAASVYSACEMLTVPTAPVRCVTFCTRRGTFFQEVAAGNISSDK